MAANGVYQLFMISHSPVNWERQGEQWNANFVLSALFYPASAQALPVLVINQSMFVTLHSKLPFSSLPGPSANEPIPQNSTHLFSFIFTHQDDSGFFLRSDEVKREMLNQFTGKKRLLSSVHTCSCREWVCLELFIEFCLRRKVQNYPNYYCNRDLILKDEIARS